MSLTEITTLTASLGFMDRKDPFGLFADWFADAKKSEPNDPNGMALATVDDEGLPNVRMVLMKDYDERGFVFYTNYESQKGQEILSNMKAALLFHWKSLRRQVRVRGVVEKVTDAEADAYFASRPRDSQIGAWASKQSQVLQGRFAARLSCCCICRSVSTRQITKRPRARKGAPDMRECAEATSRCAGRRNMLAVTAGCWSARVHSAPGNRCATRSPS